MRVRTEKVRFDDISISRDGDSIYISDSYDTVLVSIDAAKSLVSAISMLISVEVKDD